MRQRRILLWSEISLLMQKNSDEKHRLWKLACNGDAVRTVPGSNLDIYGGMDKAEEAKTDISTVYSISSEYISY
jgi:hypothetical protein